jgi:hypothetical protein
MKKHLAQMAIAGSVVLAVLTLFGVPLSTGLRYALLLACPVMMMWMMTSMNRGTNCDHDGHDHVQGSSQAPALGSSTSEPSERHRNAHE